MAPGGLVQCFAQSAFCFSYCTNLFLVADTQIYKRLCPSIGPSVGPSVRTLHFTFFVFLRFCGLTAPAQMIKWPQISSCPPARDWGSRVSGLVLALGQSKKKSHAGVYCDWRSLNEFFSLNAHKRNCLLLYIPPDLIRLVRRSGLWSLLRLLVFSE